MNKELTSEKTKELEENLKPRRFFSEKQIINAEKSFSKWLHYIIAETGYGKIEIFIDASNKIIDVSPKISFRFFRD